MIPPSHRAAKSDTGAGPPGESRRRLCARTFTRAPRTIYEGLVDAVKDVENRTEDQNKTFFNDLTTKLIVFGPTPVIKAWVSWRQTPDVDYDDDGPFDPTSLLAFERVLLAARADLGHDNSALEPGDLLRVYVNDFGESVAAWLASIAAVAQKSGGLDGKTLSV